MKTWEEFKSDKSQTFNGCVISQEEYDGIQKDAQLSPTISSSLVEDKGTTFECSNCKKTFPISEKRNYCGLPHCHECCKFENTCDEECT